VSDEQNELQAAGATGTRPSGRRAWVVPLLLSGAALAIVAIGLMLDSREAASPSVGRPVPDFSLPPVKGRAQGLSSSDLKGEVSLVNVFASWCVPCRLEHPILVALQREGLVPIYGLNYKDRPEDAAPWLDKLGDPYKRTGADIDGRVGIDWGVYGVPQTFVVDSEGRIAYTHVGPLTSTIVEEELRPRIRELRAGSGRVVGVPATAGAR
jgi:cytochrome c biogenesis protein CcmG/thiol:disulfide interchange protein DsbE